MPYNGSGTFNLSYNWPNDAANSIPIEATRMQAQEQDMATGLSNCLTRDGQSTWLANQPAGGFKITGLANGGSSSDSAALGQVFQIVNNLSEGVAATILTNIGAAGSGANTDITSLANVTSITGFAKSGANSDITSLTGITTPFTVAQGGTGLATLTSHALQVGAGTSTPAQVTGTAAQLLIAQSSANPAFETMSGDATLAAGGAVTLATVNSNVGSFTNVSATVNAKGLITAISSGTAPGVVAWMLWGGGSSPSIISSSGFSSPSISRTSLGHFTIGGFPHLTNALAIGQGVDQGTSRPIGIVSLLEIGASGSYNLVAMNPNNTYDDPDIAAIIVVGS